MQKLWTYLVKSNKCSDYYYFTNNGKIFTSNMRYKGGIIMIPNKQCMKDILKFISENAKVRVDNMGFHNITISTLNVTTLLDKMSKEGERPIDEVAYNFLQCYYNEFINVNIKFQQGMIQSATSDIIGITFAGVDFLNQN